MKSLLTKMLTQLIICIVILFLLATPLFYLLTKHYYAEDMIDIISAVEQGKPMPAVDLEKDIMKGIVLQFTLIMCVLGIAIIVVTRLISKRLWKPFNETLNQLENFKLENGSIPVLPDCTTQEFVRLNCTLNQVMENSLKSYKVQKEFTENASHELQTPLAVFQGKLDILLQQQDLTEQQAEMIQGLYQVSSRLSRLNRNLLLLAKIDNKQYYQMDDSNVALALDELLPLLENLLEGITLNKKFLNKELTVKGNKILLDSLLNNLIVNAVRHNQPEGEIEIEIEDNKLTISNTSEEAPLDGTLIYNRFYRPSEKTRGNGLGLAIVKTICDYHNWKIEYYYLEKKHHFTIEF